MFKKVLLAVAVSSASTAAFANGVQGYFGFRSGAPTFGAAYDHRVSDGYHLGGFLNFAGDEEDAGVREIITIAGRAKIGFRPISPDLNLYVAPGFGIHMIEDGSLKDGDDVTAIGPTMQLGVTYQATPTTAFGVEVLNIYNWLNDEATTDAQMVNATVTVSTY